MTRPHWLILLVVVCACDRGSPQRARGQEAIAALKQRLVERLTAAMQEGPPNAIAVCSAEAPAIAAALSKDGITVGRATRKPRNPANAATGWRADALSHFEAQLASGTALAGTSFAVQLPGGGVGYAEPLVIQELCTKCHGASLAPEIAAALAERYPDDQATGYAVGDLRGIAWAEVR